MTRKPSTYSQRQAARSRARTRPAMIGMGAFFAIGSAALASLVTLAALNPPPAASPAHFAACVTLGAVMALGCATVAALCAYEARP